jgi:anti-anti-sigma factor
LVLAEQPAHQLRLAGVVDYSTVQDIELGVADMLDRDRGGDFVVDVSHVTFMDSAGINLLVRILHHTHERGGDAVLVNASPQLRRVLDITGLEDLFTYR